MEKRRKFGRGRPGTYNHRIIITTNMEANLKEEFEDYAYSERKSFAEALQDIMREAIERKKSLGVLAGNPINISYDNHIKPIKQEPLDKYLEENFVTSKDWFSFYQRIDDIAQVERHEALAVTISKQARQRMHFLKTGKCLAR